MDQENYDRADWQNPLVLGTNKLPPRNSAWPCPDAASAWQSDYDHSPWVMSLNGQWDFSWAPNPAGRPADFNRLDFDAGSWRKIPVPSCWELEGFKIEPVGQPNYGVPMYTNYVYPFATTNPGRVMDTPPEDYNSFRQRNPVGSYRRTFVLPADWNGGRTILHFGGVYSAMYVWVNEQKVGYSQDSRSPAEFDVTDFLQPGDNLLAVEVYRWCAGSYLEDQDMWRLSGIYRDVFLCHTPEVSLWDTYLDTQLCRAGSLTPPSRTRRQGQGDETSSQATIQLRYTLRRTARIPGLAVRLTLRDPVGNLVGGAPLLTESVTDAGITAPITIDRPLLWTNETPHLYDALIELLSEGTVIEARRLDVGFRTVTLRGREYLVNNQPIKMKGVNRHESSPIGGYTITRQDMERDLALMKQANINFVRTSHYPNDPRWYELCNRWGMFVVDEANVESHGLSYHKKVLPGDDPNWQPMAVDRMQRMVIRDRNHPCVVMWSLGNEAGYGAAFVAMREATLAADPQQRPIQYADMNLAADVDSQTYPTTEWLHQHLAGKAVRKGEHSETGSPEQHGPYPSGRGFVCNEYAHAHSNALGNFKDYWDVFEAHPMFWGGFIWEWADQTLNKVDADGVIFPASGGDFGDVPNSGIFCTKGLVDADRMPRPHYWEAKKVHQYIKITAEAIAEGRVKIRNGYSFTRLSAFDAEWLLEEDGLPIASGSMGKIEAAPGDEVAATVPWGSRPWRPGHEYFLTIRFRLRTKQPWADAGHIVAWEQLPVARIAPAAVVSRGPGPVRRGNDWALATGGVEARIDGKSGLLSSLRFDGREMLCANIVLHFWRIPTPSDTGWKVPQLMGAWANAGQNARLESLTPTDDGLLAKFALPEVDSAAQIAYRLSAVGTVLVQVELDREPSAPELPRLGVQLAVPLAMGSVRWYGRGPQENYRDRLSGAAVGVYQSSVENWITHYVQPQENANREDIRWIEFLDSQGTGLRINAIGRLLSASARPYTDADMSAGPHEYQLPRRPRITINIDGFQMGVGGDSSWGLPVHERYRLMDKGRYGFAFELSRR